MITTQVLQYVNLLKVIDFAITHTKIQADNREIVKKPKELYTT